MGNCLSQHENEGGIIGLNRRMLTDEEVRRFPYNLIGYLRAEFLADNGSEGISVDGSACLISPTLILTAAHNIFVKKIKNKEPISCHFTLGLHGKNGKTTKVKKYYISEVYKTSCSSSEEDRKNDYALLEVEPIFSEEESKNIKFLEILTEAPEKGEKVGVFGYPVDCNHMINPASNDQGNRINRQFGSTGQITKNQNKYISYAIPTSQGQSGSPVIYENSSGEFALVGVHKGNFRTLRKVQNYAISIKAMHQDLQRWTKDLKIEIFQKDEMKNWRSFAQWKDSIYGAVIDYENYNDESLDSRFRNFQRKFPSESDVETILNIWKQEFSKDYLPFFWYLIFLIKKAEPNFKQSLKICDLILEKNDKLSRVFNEKGFCYDQIGEKDEAFRCYELCIDAENSKCYSAYNNKAVWHFERRNYDEAIKCSKKAIEINKKYEKAYKLLSAIFKKPEYFNQGVSYYKQLISEDNMNILASDQLGYLLSKQHRYDQAISVGLENLKSSPQENHAHTYLLLGECYANKRCFAEAIEAFKKCPQEMPEVYLNIGKCFYKQGDYTKAIASYQREIEIHGTTKLVQELIDQAQKKMHSDLQLHLDSTDADFEVFHNDIMLHK